MSLHDFQDALGLQHKVEPFEKLRLGLVQAYAQKRVWLLRGLAVEALDGLAATEGRHFVEQSIELLLRSKTKHEERQSLATYLRSQARYFCVEMMVDIF